MTLTESLKQQQQKRRCVDLWMVVALIIDWIIAIRVGVFGAK